MAWDRAVEGVLTQVQVPELLQVGQAGRDPAGQLVPREIEEPHVTAQRRPKVIASVHGALKEAASSQLLCRGGEQQA